MTSNSERCRRCGSPNCGWLDDNCPTCLMRLGEATIFRQSPAAVLSSPVIARSLGGYELLEEIARGGMGVVYRARQQSLNRQVAVKVLLGGEFANETFIKRFRLEAEAAASLSHPNIVAIHEVGEHQGQLYFSMDLIEGSSLADLIHDHPLPARQAAQLIRTVAEAVAFAHGHRLLHRDLKPSNVLLDEQGVPHVTDFGLAKRFDADAELTLTGQILGSPNYMAPEQADPDLGPTTAASDVYSLGAMLYHVLTGRPPFLAETVAQTLRLVVEGQPASPSLLLPGISRDLETICLKCLETDPKLRYASALEVADELGCYLSDEPIHARPLGPFAKLARWCRRKPALASSLGIVATLLLVLGVGSPIALLWIRGERELSEAARQQEAALRIRAETAEREGRQQLFNALVGQADAAVSSGEMGQRVRALEAVRQAAAISNSVALRRTALAALALPDLRFERELPTGPEYTLQVLDPAFEQVALCRGRGPVEIRSVTDRQLLATLPGSANLPAYIGWWSFDARYFAVKRDRDPGGERADLEVWRMLDHQRVLVLNDMMYNAMSFHPLQHRLITAQRGTGVTTWDLEQGIPIAESKLASPPLRLEFAPDGAHFAAVLATADGCTVSIHDATTGVQQAIHTFPNSVMGLNWHPSGRWVALADGGGMVHLMDPQTGAARTLGPHKAQAVTAAFSPDGDYLLSGGWEGELICWDMRTMQRSFTIGRQSWMAHFRRDGRECALITKSGIQLHAFERPSHRAFADDLGPRLHHAAFSPDGRWLAASAGQYLGVWDLTKAGPGALVKELADARPGFSADGKVLFAGGSDGKCSTWRIFPGTKAGAPPVMQSDDTVRTEEFASLSAVSNVIAFTGPRGSRLAGRDCLAATNADWVRTAQGITGVSPDARWLGIYESYTPWLHLYRLPGLEPVATLTNQANISDFAFSPLGNEVAVSSPSGVELWSTSTWTRNRLLTNFIGILFSQQESACWLTKDYRTAGLYNAATLEPLLPLPTGTLPLALSLDGRHLAVGIDGRYLQVWDVKEVQDQLRELGIVPGIDSLEPTDFKH